MKMTDIMTRNNKHHKLLICIYTNNDRNEFDIGLKEDENFRAMTKLGEFTQDLLMPLRRW